MLEAILIVALGLPWLSAFLIMMVQRNQSSLAIGGGALTALSAWMLLPHMGVGPVATLPIGLFGDVTFTVDMLGVGLVLVATNIGLLVTIYSRAYIMHSRNRYYATVLVFIGAMNGLALTSHLLALLFFWEITALCSFALIAFEVDKPAARQGGIQALIITQIGGAGLLIATLAAFNQTGSYQFEALQSASGVSALIAYGILLAAVTKSAQVPFHSWLPGAMEAPTPISALIHAATMVNAGIYLLARFAPVCSPVAGWLEAVMIVGVVTALYAATAACFSFDLKHILAYSTVSQLGYMVYAVGAGGIFASQFHLLSHAVFKALLFLAAGILIHAVGSRDIRQMGGGLPKAMPFVYAVFLIGAAALLGLPPLNGFWSKELVISQGGSGFGMLLTLTAAITGFYTSRMVWWVFHSAGKTDHMHTPPTRWFTAPVLILAALIPFTWLLVNAFSGGLAATLPYHDIALLTVHEMAIHVSHGAVLVVGAAVGGGVVWFISRTRLDDFTLPTLKVNQWVVNSVRDMAATASLSQTGKLSWNVATILVTVIFLMLLVVLL